MTDRQKILIRLHDRLAIVEYRRIQLHQRGKLSREADNRLDRLQAQVLTAIARAQ